MQERGKDKKMQKGTIGEERIYDEKKRILVGELIPSSAHRVNDLKP